MNHHDRPGTFWRDIFFVSASIAVLLIAYGVFTFLMAYTVVSNQTMKDLDTLDKAIASAKTDVHGLRQDWVAALRVADHQSTDTRKALLNEIHQGRIGLTQEVTQFRTDIAKTGNDLVETVDKHGTVIEGQITPVLVATTKTIDELTFTQQQVRPQLLGIAESSAVTSKEIAQTMGVIRDLAPQLGQQAQVVGAQTVQISKDAAGIADDVKRFVDNNTKPPSKKMVIWKTIELFALGGLRLL
jgi:hypothetical protein